MRRKDKRGIALITVLTVMFLLTMMTGALIGNHQANFAILGDSIHQREAVQTAASALDYAKYRLEFDRNFAAAPLADLSQSWGDMNIHEIGGTRTIEGSFEGSIPPRTFKIQIENCLNARSAGLPAYVKPTTITPPGAPFVWLRIAAYCGPYQTVTETILNEAPLYDAAAISNGFMGMDGVNRWTVASKDPLRNWVRSNDYITTPDFLGSPGTKRMDFVAAPGQLPGVAWSKASIYSGTKDEAHDIKGIKLPLANAATHGMMAPHSNLNYNIYDLKIADLAPSDVSIPPTNVKSGTWTVTSWNASYTQTTWRHRGWGNDDWNGNWNDWHEYVAVESHNVTVPVKDLKHTDAAGHITHYLFDENGNTVPKPVEHQPVNNQWAGWEVTNITNVVLPPDGTSEAVTNPVFDLTDDSTAVENKGNMSFDFLTQDFTAKTKTELDVNGDFTINNGTMIARSGDFSQKNSSPIVAFNDAESPGKLGFFHGLKNNSGVGGNVNLVGTVTGKGAVAADRDLTMGANSNMSAENIKLVLWAGNDVNFAVTNGGNMSFTGLVYANHDVKLSFGPNGATGALDQLKLWGALVARTGNIQMNAAASVNMTYDPDYLKLFTKGLPGGRARFAQVSFKVY